MVPKSFPIFYFLPSSSLFQTVFSCGIRVTNLATTETIQSLIDLAFILVRSKSKNKKNEGYQCAVSQTQVEWLALTAFHFVLHSKQAKYLDVLAWLDTRIQALRDKKGKKCTHLMEVVSTRAPTRMRVE